MLASKNSHPAILDAVQAPPKPWQTAPTRCTGPGVGSRRAIQDERASACPPGQATQFNPVGRLSVPPLPSPTQVNVRLLSGGSVHPALHWKCREAQRAMECRVRESEVRRPAAQALEDGGCIVVNSTFVGRKPRTFVAAAAERKVLQQRVWR
jgi:hypothetical protein